MSIYFESIPNISEGRDPAIVAACVDAVRSVDGITLMNFSSDYDHNRSVITFILLQIGLLPVALRRDNGPVLRRDDRERRNDW